MNSDRISFEGLKLKDYTLQHHVYFTRSDGRPIVTFRQDGRVELGEGAEPDEAAKAMFGILEPMLRRAFGAELEAGHAGGGVVVRALEWSEGDGITAGEESWIAQSLGLVYFVIECQWWVSLSTKQVTQSQCCESNDAAKAAAQADYEARIRAALAPSPSAGEVHPDDLAVDRFAAAMKTKLAKKRADGYGGWADKEMCTGGWLSFLLRDHVDKGDPVDVGNLAMMLHQRGERIATPPATPVKPTASVEAMGLRNAAFQVLEQLTNEFGWAPDARPDEAVSDDPDCGITWGRLHKLQAAIEQFDASLTPAPTQGDGAQQLLDKALTVLGRCHTVLFNMAKENKGAIFNRWPIHHEPLRSDARNLLPLIDEVLGHD